MARRTISGPCASSLRLSGGFCFRKILQARVWRLVEARAMEKDLLVAFPCFLLLDVLERVAQRLNRRLDGRFDVAPFELETVDFALDILETRLGFFEQQVGAAVRFADDAVRLLLSARLDV